MCPKFGDRSPGTVFVVGAEKYRKVSAFSIMYVKTAMVARTMATTNDGDHDDDDNVDDDNDDDEDGNLQQWRLQQNNSTSCSKHTYYFIVSNPREQERRVVNIQCFAFLHNSFNSIPLCTGYNMYHAYEGEGGREYQHVRTHAT